MSEHNGEVIFYSFLGFACGVFMFCSMFYVADMTKLQQYHRCRVNGQTIERCVEVINFER